MKSLLEEVQTQLSNTPGDWITIHTNELHALIDVAKAADEYFTIDELAGLEFSPFFKAYTKVREALDKLQEKP